MDTGDDPQQIARILRDYTQRTIHVQLPNGTTVSRQPSLRWIEQQTGIRHQRISEFLRNPEGATPAALQRIAGIIDAPTLQQVYQGERVTYLDVPALTESVLDSITVPANAVAYRFVVPTEEVGYNGYRSTEWTADFDRMAELADAAPGGRTAIARIVFDTGD